MSLYQAQTTTALESRCCPEHVPCYPKKAAELEDTWATVNPPPPPASGIRLYVPEDDAFAEDDAGLFEKENEESPAPSSLSPLARSELQKIIVEYLPLVRSIVRQLVKRLPANVQQDDLISAGVCGLVDSLRRNGGDQGPTFIWYARTRIRGAIFDELRAQDWLSRRARNRADSLAETTGLASASFVSIEDVPGIEDDGHLATSEDPLEVAEASCLYRMLALAIDQLPERERRIVGRHYFEGMKFKDIGAELGVSEPRISQLHARALDRLRALLDRAA